MGKKFGEYLRTLREDRGLTLREVENKAKVSNAYLSQVERGERSVPNFKVLSRLADVYGVPSAKLMEAAETEAKKGTIETKLQAPDVEFVSRGYEKLSEDKKMALKSFLQHLVKENKKEEKK